jgi:biopolymer transport protein ExbD
MGRFRGRSRRGVPPLSTASLPDIVFMILFFFMVSTTLRQTEVKVRVNLPSLSQAKKLEKKSQTSYIYIGRPMPGMQAKYGTEPMIQLNDKLINRDGVPAEAVQDFILTEREQLAESEKNKMTVSLKIDRETPMGIVSDVKQALRSANALKINYSSSKDNSSAGDVRIVK